MADTRALRAAVLAALLLGAAMTLGDFLWASLHLGHRVAYGLAHGAVMCFCIGTVIGVRVGRPVAAAAAGPVVGLLAAGSFYLLSPVLGWGAMFPAWMLFWILFALLQQRLRGIERLGSAIVRGLTAAVLSGLAFYAISGIWTRPSDSGPDYGVHFASWAFAFLPGFLTLFWQAPHGSP